VRVINNLTINSTCYNKTSFTKDVGDYFSLVEIDPKDLTEAIIGNLEYLKFKINKIGCCTSNLRTGSVGTRRSVVFGNCDAIDFVLNEWRKKSLKAVFNSIACGNAVPVKVAGNLNVSEELLDSDYKFLPGAGEVSLLKIGSIYFTAVYYQAGNVQPPIGKMGFTENVSVDGKSVTIHTFGWSDGSLDRWVLKTSNPDLNFANIYTSQQVSKLFETRKRFTLEEAEMLSLEAKCKVREIIANGPCDPKKFLNLMSNILEEGIFIINFETETILDTILTGNATFDNTKHELIDLCFSYLTESCAKDVYKAIKGDNCLFQKLLVGTKSKNFDFLNWYETQISKDADIVQECLPLIMVAVASEDFWPRFSKLNKIECNTEKCLVNIKQFLYDKVTNTAVIDRGGNTLDFIAPEYEKVGTNYG
ncbi:MAG TPA: hypothetical protein PKD85_21545, partial [Saprospiraceae bacterium]|nr:hypothetical protein [Saprospiraceae bacterium]